MFVNKIHFQPKMQWMICTMLDFVWSVSLDIWHIEWYVCFWPLWFSKATISSTVIMFSPVRVCFSLLVSCLWLLLHVFQIPVINILTLFAVALHLEKFCQYFPKTVFFEPVQVLYQSLVSTAKWHITSPVYRQCIKNYYLRQYHLLLFTNIRNACNNENNLIFVWKLVKIVSEDDFGICIIMILVIFENLCFTW